MWSRLSVRYQSADTPDIDDKVLLSHEGGYCLQSLKGELLFGKQVRGDDNLNRGPLFSTEV